MSEIKEIIISSDKIHTDQYLVNMGPQHPSTHGVLRLLVRLEGEIVHHIQPHVGYIHSGIEKMCEAISYPQVIHLTDRMDYLSAHMNNEAVALCVENALQIEVPERVKYIRTIMDELSRLASHQLWWCVMGMDLGALTTFSLWPSRPRTHSRYFRGDLRRQDDTELQPSWWSNVRYSSEFPKRVKEFIKEFKKKLPEYDQLLTGNVIFQERTKEIGYLSREDAIAWGVTGPSGRGSGFSCDVRKHQPYSAYPLVQFEEKLDTRGDTFTRYRLRIEEMYESMHIIEQLIDNIPEGDYAVKMKGVVKLPEGEFYQRVESARGEFGVYIVSDGKKNPYRVKFRSPGFSNLFALNKMASGHKIADLVAIMSTLDLVIPDIDR